jgi:hypothetical protein
MITSADIEKRRSPHALRDFVVELKRVVRADELERHRGIQKAGLYKEFLDEIVPLSLFALHAYPESYEVQPVLGNQGYDALVFDQSGNEVDRIELTVPHDGAAAAKDARLIVVQGYGRTQVGTPGDDFQALFPCVLAVCNKKAMKDYGDCSLVVAIEPMLPFESFEALYETQIEALASEMGKIQFRAKRVFFLVMPDHIRQVYG